MPSISALVTYDVTRLTSVVQLGNTSRSNFFVCFCLFCFSLIKSEPTQICPEELKFEVKQIYKYSKNKQLKLADERYLYIFYVFRPAWVSVLVPL